MEREPGRPARHPRPQAHRRSQRCQGDGPAGHRYPGPLPSLRLGTGGHVEPVPRRGVGWRACRGDPRPGLPRAPGAHGQHPPIASGRPQLRVLLGGPVPHGPDRRRVHQGGAGRWNRHDHQALRGQRLGVRAQHDRFSRPGACAAGDLPEALRDGRRGGGTVGADGRLQQGERQLRLRAPRPADRGPVRRMGVRRRGGQ